MAESPVLTLARLLGGVVLMEGRLGHQILGQMFVLGSNEVALAGAVAVVTATTGQRNAAAQIAVRTVVPALAVRGLLQKQERRIERKETLIAERERKLEETAARIAALEENNRQLQGERERLSTRLRSLEMAATGPVTQAAVPPAASHAGVATAPAAQSEAAAQPPKRKKRPRPPSKS